MKFKEYTRKNIAQIREVGTEDFESFYNSGEILAKVGTDTITVSISEQDRLNGSPKVGDMIGRNPDNHKDQWLIARRYFLDNFQIKEEKSDDSYIVRKEVNGELRLINHHGVKPYAYYQVREGLVEYQKYKNTYQTRHINILDLDGVIRVYRVGVLKKPLSMSEKGYKIPVIDIMHPMNYWTNITLRKFLEESEKEYELIYIKDFSYEKKEDQVEGYDPEKLKTYIDTAIDLLENHIN